MSLRGKVVLMSREFQLKGLPDNTIFKAEEPVLIENDGKEPLLREF